LGQKKIIAELRTTFHDSAMSNLTIKDGSESSKMAIYSVMTIHVLVDPSQYWDESYRSFLIGIHFQAPVLYQDTFIFLFQL
jgi:cell wall assembly regulator SMI1